MSSGLAIAPPRDATLRTRPCKPTKRAEDAPPATVMPPTQRRGFCQGRYQNGKCGGTGAGHGGEEGWIFMLDPTRRLVTPSLRSDVPAFIVMDVVARAARLEAMGRRIIHMEVGQPAAAAPTSARAAAQAALGGPVGYTESLGIAPLRARIARPLPRTLRHRPRSRPRRGDHRLLSGLHARLSRDVRAGRPGRHRLPGLPALPQHPRSARLRAGGDRDVGAYPVGPYGGRRDRRASRAPARRRPVREPGQSDRHHDDRGRARHAGRRCGRRGHPLHLRRDLPRPRLRVPGADGARLFRQGDDHQFVLEVLLHDRVAGRLDGGPGSDGPPDRAAAAEFRDIGADALPGRGARGIRRRCRDGGGQARLRGQPPRPRRGPAERRPRQLPPRRRRLLPLCRRLALLRRQLRALPAACWRKRASPRRPASISIPSTGGVSFASAMQARPTRCARRWSGSPAGSATDERVECNW